MFLCDLNPGHLKGAAGLAGLHKGMQPTVPALLITQERPILQILIRNFPVFKYRLKQMETQYSVRLGSGALEPEQLGFWIPVPLFTCM